MGRIDIVQLLCNYGIDVNEKYAYYFEIAVERNCDFGILRQLILANLNFYSIDFSDEFYHDLPAESLLSCLIQIQDEIEKFHEIINDLDIFHEFSQELEPFIYRQDIEDKLNALLKSKEERNVKVPT